MDNSKNDTDSISMLKKLATSSLSPVWNQIKKMPHAILELDSAMTDLQLTTKSTATELEVFYKHSNEVAKSLGISTSAVIQATTDWTKLGYSIKEAQSLAKTSSILSSISPGMDISNATKAIANAMKVYGIEAGDTLDGIASKINIVGKSLSISNQDISEILNTSATAMKAANIGLEETIALGTAAQSTIHDTMDVGNALNTVSSRIQGFDGETNNLSANLAQLNRDIYNLTNHQVSIRFDDNTYKDIYTILDEINRVWGNLTDSQRSGILSELFSPEQANAGAAIITNFDKARQAIDLMQNSAGNAMAEMNAVYDSLEFKINHLAETGTGIAQNLFEQDDMKTVLDMLNRVGEALDFVTEKFGLFGTAGATLGAVLGAKNLGIVYECTQSNHCLLF